VTEAALTCVFCLLGRCVIPGHPIEDQPIPIFDIQRSSVEALSKPTFIPLRSKRDDKPKSQGTSEPTIIVHGLPLRDYLHSRFNQRSVHLEEWALKKVEKKKKTGDKEFVKLLIQAWSAAESEAKEKQSHYMTRARRTRSCL
jgi:hypothetical protein